MMDPPAMSAKRRFNKNLIAVCPKNKKHSIRKKLPLQGSGMNLALLHCREVLSAGKLAG